MAVTLYERHDSRDANVSATGGSVTIRHTAVGSVDENEIYVAVLAATPPVYDGFLRSTIDIKFLGGPVATVEVTYGPVGAGGSDQPVGASGLGGEEGEAPSSPGNEEPLGPNYSVQMSGGTRHRDQSIRTVRSQIRPDLDGVEELPNFRRSIGVTENAVEGVDVAYPTFEWTVTVSRPHVTIAYLKTLRGCIGKVNNDAFYNFPAWTLLYLGCDAQYTQGDQWSLTHKFRYEPNEVTVELGEGWVIHPLTDDTDPQYDEAHEDCARRGHEYIWVKHFKDVETGRVAPRPLAAYIEQVYDPASFVVLEIGV